MGRVTCKPDALGCGWRLRAFARDDRALSYLGTPTRGHTTTKQRAGNSVADPRPGAKTHALSPARIERRYDALRFVSYRFTTTRPRASCELECFDFEFEMTVGIKGSNERE